MGRKALSVIQTGGFDDLWARALKEGINSGAEIMNANVTISSGTTPGSGTALASIQTAPTEILLIKSFSVSVDNGSGILQIASNGTGPDNTADSRSNRWPIKNNVIQASFEKRLLPCSRLDVSIYGGDGTTVSRVGFNLNCMRMTADLNFNANKVIMWIGDSISKCASMGGTVFTGSNITNATTYEDTFLSQVVEGLKDRGHDCRLVLKAMGGYRSLEWEYYRKNGFLDIDQCDAIFYQLGVNDASNASQTSDADFTKNINNLIRWRNRRYKNIPPIVLIGDTPLNDTAKENRLIQLRSIKETIATENSNNSVYYISIANAFDRTVISNYTSNDGVHPNLANQVNMSNAILSELDRINFKL